MVVLAWAAVPVSLAAKWAGRAVPTTQVVLPWLEITLPLGPYLTLAALLAIVGTVGFLAFAVTEDRYSTALSDALLSRPAERCLLLALPYVALNEPRRRSERRPGRRRSAAKKTDARTNARDDTGVDRAPLSRITSTCGHCPSDGQ